MMGSTDPLELPVKCSVAVVLRCAARPGEFLAVRRPPDDDRLPDVWGLPAVTLRTGELPEAAVRRLGREKLGADIQASRFVGVRAADRQDHLLILMDLEAGGQGGQEGLVEGAEKLCQQGLNTRRRSEREPATTHDILPQLSVYSSEAQHRREQDGLAQVGEKSRET